jgi:ubiquinone/menaquinone biosynthesis C-methylase UbiE
MIAQAERKLTRHPYNNVEFKVGSGSSLDYADYFDYVLSTNAYHHFAEKKKDLLHGMGITEIRRGFPYRRYLQRLPIDEDG